MLHVLNSASGGAALSTIGLMEAMRGYGIEPCAVCHTAGTQLEREQLRAAADGRVVFTPLYWWNRKIRAKLWKRPLLELRQLWVTGFKGKSTAAVAQAARDWQVELIHTNTICNPEGGLAARRLGLPHVWHLRELIGPGRPFRLPLEGAALADYLRTHCSLMVANSNTTAELARASVPPDLLTVVPNGIDLSRFTPRPFDPRRRPIVVAMVGSPTSRWKKHGLFVAAAALVDRSLPLEFRIYGHDPSRGGTVRGDEYVDALHDQIAAAGIRDQFAWPGFVGDPARIMSEIDILVHQADDESFGRVVVEAMAASLPVVGVQGGGVGEIVLHETTGLLAPPDNAAALATHIERLARDPALRKALGAAGRRRAETTYSLESCAAGMLEAYETAMDRPLGASRKAASTG
ncbi:MAG: glycosyltransferase family 4 protein [Pirellulales bacterium]|nr:glycosyltransferase family 4 protein [Pirellulales bacterium]